MDAYIYSCFSNFKFLLAVVKKVMRLIFYLPKFLLYSNINVIPFKIVPLGSYTPIERFFPLLEAALEDFNRYDIQHVRYTLLDVL